MNSRHPGLPGLGWPATRRNLLAGMGALAAAGLVPGRLRAQSAPRVVVIGGGWGGISAARGVRNLLPDAEVTLIEPNGAFMSCPMSVHYLVGDRNAESLTFSYAALDRDNIRRIQARSEAIDRDNKTVVLPDARLPYDYLIVSPGIDYMYDAIDGFAEHRDQLPVAFRAFEQTALREALDAYDGGDIVLSVPPLPYRCPIAPYERAAVFADWLERSGRPGRVILLDQNPDIPIGKPAIEAAFAELHADRLEHRKGVQIEAIDPGAREVRTDQGTISYGVAAILPPQQAGAIVRTAGLGQRWAPVRFPHFLSAEDDDIYIIGDAVGSPLPKSGHLAFETGQMVAAHIAARVQDAEIDDDEALPSAICFAFFNNDEAMAVNITNRWNDLTEEIQRQAAVDPIRSAGAADMAENWSRSVWSQLLG
jgi:NADH dehydrogenase FAD-containing subunit